MGAMEGSMGKPREKVSVNYFEFKHIIGRGGFGKVWKVVCKKNGKEYAIKVMSKVKIIDRKSQKSILSERNLLSKLHHPFLVNMIYSFQDTDHLYLVMDLLTGGDLRFHISRFRYFTKEQTKFFMACLILGLEYIHDNFVIHRDIKPENLVCDEKGYIRITDFGVAKKYHKDNANETSGTPGYMAPEVLCAQNHSYEVDYFALGVIGFEFMLGKRPYHGRSRKDAKQDVLAKQVVIKPKDIPLDWPLEAIDLINSLIQRKPSQRLGFNGIREIKSHPWFIGFSWNLVAQKKMESPFVPKTGDNYDRHYCEGEDKISEETQNRYNGYKKSESYELFFRKYTCNNIPHEEYLNLSGQCLNSNNTIGSSNTTISSMKKTTTAGKMKFKDLNHLNMGTITKFKMKAHNSYLDEAKTPIAYSSIMHLNASASKERMFRIKNAFLSPSDLLHSNINFPIINASNLPLINTSRRPVRKSNSLQSIFPAKITPSSMPRPQTKLNPEKSLSSIISVPINVRHFNFSGNFLASSLGMSQIKRNNSTTRISNNMFNIN